MDARLVAALRKTPCPGPGPQCRADPIELSNACRAFYQSRLETARVLRERWGTCSASSGSQSEEVTDVVSEETDGEKDDKNDKNDNRRKKSSLEKAIDKLRQEMTSLMEQDLSLMRQLLTLNEEIEELKWRRRYCWSRTSSVMTSSGDVDLGSLASFTSSEASLGWWRGSLDLPGKYPGISSLSLYADHARLSVYDEEDPTGTFNRHAARAAKGCSPSPARTMPSAGMTSGGAGGGNGCGVSGSGGSSGVQLQSSSSSHQLQQQQKQVQQHQLLPRIVVATGVNVSREGGGEEKKEKEESFDSGIHEGYADTSVHTNSRTEVTHL